MEVWGKNWQIVVWRSTSDDLLSKGGAGASGASGFTGWQPRYGLNVSLEGADVMGCRLGIMSDFMLHIY